SPAPRPMARYPRTCSAVIRVVSPPRPSTRAWRAHRRDQAVGAPEGVPFEKAWLDPESRSSDRSLAPGLGQPGVEGATGQPLVGLAVAGGGAGDDVGGKGRGRGRAGPPGALRP